MKFYNLLFFRNVLAATYSTLQKLIVFEHLLYTVLLFRQFITFIVILCSTKKKEIITEFKTIPIKKHIELFIISLLYGVCVIMIYIALLYIPINMFSLIEQTLVIGVSIFMGVLFLKEKINKSMIIGFLISIIGLGLIVTKGSLTFDIPMKGLLILFVYSILMGIASVMSNQLIKGNHVSSMLFASVSGFYRLVLYIPLPFIFGEKILSIFSEFEYYHWLILFLAAGGLFVVDYIGAVVTHHISYTVRQLSILIIPTVSSFLGMFIMNEWFIFIQYLGFAFILVGLGFIFINKSNKK